MLVKKFEAPSLEDALKQVKTELGPEALILSSHRKKTRWFQPARIEVTAAYMARPAPPDENSDDNTGFDEKELMELFPHRKPEGDGSIRRADHQRYADLATDRAPALDPNRFLEGFRHAGFSEPAARELSRRLAADYPASELTHPSFLEKTRTRLIAAGLRTLMVEAAVARGIWVAVGTAGSGKTSFLVKLALQLKNRSGGVSLLSADHRKVLGRRELMTYARLIRVPFAEEGRSTRAPAPLQLVDSPALQLGEPPPAALETLCRGRSVCLILDASQRLSEMLRIVEHASPLQPSAVAFTRLDLVAQYGVLYDVLKTTHLPLLAVSQSHSFKKALRFMEPGDLARWIWEGGRPS